MSQVQLKPQIIQSMDKPYEKKNWDVYKNLFLTPARLKGGLVFWRTNHKTLEQAQSILNTIISDAQNTWDNDNVSGETEEQKIKRIGTRPTSISLPNDTDDANIAARAMDTVIAIIRLRLRLRLIR